MDGEEKEFKLGMSGGRELLLASLERQTWNLAIPRVVGFKRPILLKEPVVR